MTGADALEPFPQSAVAGTTRRFPGMVVVLDKPIDYMTAWKLQTQLHAERVRDQRPDTVLILEHLPVYTLGPRTDRSHWGGNEASLRETGSDLCYVNRGGSVTYHGPGQIVAYFILRLTAHASGPRQFVELLEDIILLLLRRRNIQGHRVERKPGIWVRIPDQAKIASIGIRIEHGVTLHGFSVNVDMDLSPFQRIQPCGLEGCLSTSIATVMNAPVRIDDLKRELASILADVFSVEWSITTRMPDLPFGSLNTIET